MREALFRAAQEGKHFPLEEVVGCRQDAALTSEAMRASSIPLPGLENDVGAPVSGLIVWPYPRGSTDIIDRANCADWFLAENRNFTLTTERQLVHMGAARAQRDASLVFASFEGLFAAGLVGTGDGLTLFGAQVDVVASEMILSHVRRRSSVALFSAGSPTPAGRTRLVNGLTLALEKHRQMELSTEYASTSNAAGVRPLESHLCTSREELLDLVAALRTRSPLLSLRPYGGSQGTGVEFIGVGGTNDASAVDAALLSMRGSVSAKYGGDQLFPVSVSPYVASKKLDGRIFDCRIFVVAGASALFALPGMVRIAREPFAPRPGIGMKAMAATNMAGADTAELIEKRAVRALTDPKFMRYAGLTADRVVTMCRVATGMWALALARESERRGGDRPEFAYGSVDFVVDPDDNIVPIEMNGANVGSHPAVHPDHLSSFASAMSRAVRRSLSARRL